jgi:transcriptional regulator with XRE-family HTH domain
MLCFCSFNLESMQNRILELRKERGLTLADLAVKVGSTAQQIGRLEKGERRLTTDWMEKIALALDILPEDLMSPNHGERVVIPEIAMHTIAGKQSLKTKSDVAESKDILSEWSLPKQLLANQIGSESTMRIIQVMGDSMIPEFNPGDRVMVNTADRMPSPPGVFVLWDGFGLIIKRCEMVPHSNPPRAVLSSANANYATYEMDVKELEIQGRVVGKWQWT